MEPLFELPICIPPRHSRDRVRALHAQLRAAILQSRLKPGLKLPATRALAAAYGVSRNTVIAAYDLLLSEGYLVARRGFGTFVADVLPRFRERSASRGSGTGSDSRLNPYWRQREPLPGDHPLLRVAPRLDFNLGVPDTARFPFDIWRRLTVRSLRTASGRPASYDDAYGRPALRDAIAKHVSFARAVACSPSDVIVTAGAQQAFDLLARVLVVLGRTVVAVENPGYPPLRAAFAAFGAKIVPVPVDGEGLVVERVPEDAGIICVTPSHQYPLGAVMSARRRAALLDGLRTHFSGWLDPVPSAAGLHLRALADASVDAEAFVEKARERGVRVYSLRRCYAGRSGTPGLLFGYGTISEVDIEEAQLPYRVIPVDLGRGEQFQPGFPAIAPDNRIPAIVDHEPPGGGAPLWLFESGAILLYLAENIGRFIPADPRGRADFPHLERWFEAMSARPATLRTCEGVQDVYAKRGRDVPMRADR